MTSGSLPAKFKPYTRQTISQAPQWQHLPEPLREAVQVVSRVMPFRTNQYVMDELIDWKHVPDDPIYRLTFPHQDMLSPAEYSNLRDLVLVRKDEAAIEDAVRRMLPKNRLGEQMLRKLKCFKDANHNHTAQRPEKLEL